MGAIERRADAWETHYTLDFIIRSCPPCPTPGTPRESAHFCPSAMRCRLGIEWACYWTRGPASRGLMWGGKRGADGAPLRAVGAGAAHLQLADATPNWKDPLEGERSECGHQPTSRQQLRACSSRPLARSPVARRPRKLLLPPAPLSGDREQGGYGTETDGVLTRRGWCSPSEVYGGLGQSH